MTFPLADWVRQGRAVRSVQRVGISLCCSLVLVGSSRFELEAFDVIAHKRGIRYGGPGQGELVGGLGKVGNDWAAGNAYTVLYSWMMSILGAEAYPT